MNGIVIASPENLAALGIDIEHHFGGGCYIKRADMPAGTFLAQHEHPHDHLSVLVSGTVRLKVDNAVVQLTGPQIILVEKGRSHSVEALTDAVWLCVWATDDTDPQTVDQTILKG